MKMSEILKYISALKQKQLYSIYKLSKKTYLFNHADWQKQLTAAAIFHSASNTAQSSEASKVHLSC